MLTLPQASLEEAAPYYEPFAYRLLRISRGDVTELPGFDENSYVPALATGIPSDAWLRTGTANGVRISARALVYIILGHTAHHLGLLRERYRL